MTILQADPFSSAFGVVNQLFDDFVLTLFKGQSLEFGFYTLLFSQLEEVRDGISARRQDEKMCAVLTMSLKASSSEKADEIIYFSPSSFFKKFFEVCNVFSFLKAFTSMRIWKSVSL
jgi:hypothetical protein